MLLKDTSTLDEQDVPATQAAVTFLHPFGSTPPHRGGRLHRVRSLDLVRSRPCRGVMGDYLPGQTTGRLPQM